MKTQLTPYRVAEILESRFSREPWAHVSDLLGSDWGSGQNFVSPGQYQEAVYCLASKKFGQIPWRYQP